MSLTFAYGSNMGRAQMAERCPGHRLLGNGVLEGYRWIISKRGYANVVRSPGGAVHGVVYELTESDERSLDRHEGVDDGCYRKEVLAVDMDGSRVQCLVYVDPVVEEGTPAGEYIDRINRGIADADLPQEYVIKCIRPFVPG